jgi:hypothetical protein
MRNNRILQLLLAVTLACTTLCAQDWDHQSYNAGSLESAMLVADLNNDGWPDFVVYSTGKNPTIRVMVNQGNGVFGAPQIISTTAVDRVLLGDFNNDGHVDIARCNNQGYSIFLGDGKLHFTKVSTTAASCGARVGDFNHDGKLDLVTIDWIRGGNGLYISSTVTVYLGNGAGGFSGTVRTTGLGAATATEPPFEYVLQETGDLNRDGSTDLTVSETLSSMDRSEAHAGVMMNDGTGHFTYKRLFDSVINVDSIYVRDLDQDGWLDLVMNSQEEEPYIRKFTVLLHQPDGSYSKQMIYSQPLESGYSYSFTAPAFGDWDGDGITDLAFGEAFFSEGADQVQYWLRLLYPADKSFTSIKRNVGYPVDSISNVFSADFDRDGRPDLAYLTRDNVEVYLNRSATAPVCSAATAPLRTVTLCAPAEGATAGSPTRVVATASSGFAISAVKVYIDGVSRFIGYGNLVNTFLTLSPGAHKVTVKAWDLKGSFSSSNTFTVGSGGCTASTTNRTVTICSPANGSTVSSPAHVVAKVTDSATVTVKVYVDGVATLTTTSKSIDLSTTLPAGSHKVTVRAWDATGNFSSSTQFTVH